MKETEKHIFFWFGFLSQWHKSSFKENNVLYTTGESYMMTQKALLFGDKETADKILKSSDPKVQKALGRSVKGFNDKIWNDHKVDIIVRGNYLKFSQNPKLKEQLLNTEDKILVEGSPYDRIYGVGIKFDDPKILDEKNWRGENLLGKALMRVRDMLRQESQLN